MPPISIKRVLIGILVIMMLAKLKLVLAILTGFCQFVYDSFEPLRNCSPEARFVVMLAFLSLCLVIFWKKSIGKK